MIYNEDAYYTGYARNVRTFGGGSKGAYTALVFDTIAGLIRDKGIGEIANNTLLDMLGGSKPTLLAAIDLVIKCGYFEKRCGDGRGNKSIYYITEKGKENCPFMREKGSKIFTKRVKNFNEKGKEIYPLNKELNKELKESGGDTREAVSPTLSITTPQNFEEMEDFNLFWEKYPGEPEWSWRKEECENVWRYMSAEWRGKLVELAKAGKRYRERENDDPFWYLRNYAGQEAPAELPFLRQGTQKFIKWQNDNISKGNRMCLIHFEGRVANCLYSDLETMVKAGAKVLNDNWR